MYGEEKDEVVQLNLDDIIPNRFQPREVFDERALKELAVSIKEHGVIQPIIVRNVQNGKYEIIAGERRYKASALAGLTKIPSIIRNLDDKESSKVALLDLSEEVQDAILKEQISERHARALLNVPDSKKQKELLKKVIDEKISVRKLEEEINNLYPKEKKEEVEIEQATNGFLNNSPLIPTTVNVEEENNYGKVTIAPPEEGEKKEEKFLNYGEIGKEEENMDSPQGFELPKPIEIDKIKENSTDVNIPLNVPTSDIDGMLNITSDPITPAEKIIKETSTEQKEKTDDYFKTPDLAAVNNPSIDNQDVSITIDSPTEKEKYSVEEATEKIRKLVEDLKNHGIDINADEMNFPTSYQVIIKIQKED